MIKAEGNFSQVKMEELFRYSAIVVEPMLGVTPEAFNAVDVIPPFGSSSLFPDDDMGAAHAQPGVSLPVVRVVKAARPRVLDDEPFDSAATAPLNREDAHDAVALKYAEHDDLACRAPTALPLAVAAEHRLVALYRSGERFGAPFGDTDDLPDDAKELLGGRARDRAAKAKPVGRNAEDKIIKQPQLGALRESKRIPRETERVAMAAAATLEAAVGQGPRPMMPTLWTGSAHRARMLLKLVRFR